ncbi:MAG TPA: DinB family protein [Gemmatimonadales bacterium]|nr:DinB family protein [Gemmatimonadales bacterium]
MVAIPRPGADEYASYYGKYIDRVPEAGGEGALVDLLGRQIGETQALLAGLPEARALYRYATGKWSIKEVVGHLADAERVFAYRALRFARADETPLASFDENAFVPPGRFDSRLLSDLVAEFVAVRQATVAMLRGLPAEAVARRGTASGKSVSVRALAYIIAGHERHHVQILKERYLQA